MKTLKLILAIFTALVMLFSISGAAEASYYSNNYGSNYGTSGYQPYGGYNSPYSDNFFVYDNFNKQQTDYTNTGLLSNLFSGSQSASNNDFFAQGFLNSNYGDFNQNGAINFNDGYSFTKDGCVTKKINVNFDGKDNDFKIKETVCDGISGNFFKNNQYQNSVNNNFGYNNANVGANIAQNTFNQNLKQDNSYTNTFSNKYSSLGQSTSFGKGNQIIFY